MQRPENLLLLVEDEPLMLLFAQEALEEDGYTVISARTGADALEAMAGCVQSLSALITDIRLGSAPDGWELARRARELRPDLPVVYTTGYSSAEWPTLGVRDSSVIQKPYEPAELLAALSDLLPASQPGRTT